MTRFETDPGFWAPAPDMPASRASILWERFLRLLKLAGLAQ